MKRMIYNCVGCSTIFGNCMGAACPYHDREGIVCDICEEEADEGEYIYHFDGKDLCFSCLKDRLPSKPEDDCDECKTCNRVWLLNGEWLCEDCLLELVNDYKVENYGEAD